jgi:hypothetical protein
MRPDYRAYLVGSDDHFYKSVVLDVPDEATAIEAAEQLDDHDVERWQRDRKVAKFEQKKK